MREAARTGGKTERVKWGKRHSNAAEPKPSRDGGEAVYFKNALCSVNLRECGDSTSNGSFFGIRRQVGDLHSLAGFGPDIDMLGANARPGVVREEKPADTESEDETADQDHEHDRQQEGGPGAKLGFVRGGGFLEGIKRWEAKIER